MPELRRQLLDVHGIGPETADSILLYAGHLPSFVVDAYTHRIFARHGWIGFDADYQQIQDYVQDELPADAALYNEFHALLVRRGEGLLSEGQAQLRRMSVAEAAAAGRAVGAGVGRRARPKLHLDASRQLAVAGTATHERVNTDDPPLSRS